MIISCHSSRLQKENLLPHPIVHPSAIHHDQVQAPGHCKIYLITTNKEGLLLANFVIERGILNKEKSILTSARKSINGMNEYVYGVVLIPLHGWVVTMIGGSVPIPIYHLPSIHSSHIECSSFSYLLDF